MDGSLRSDGRQEQCDDKSEGRLEFGEYYQMTDLDTHRTAHSQRNSILGSNLIINPDRRSRPRHEFYIK